MSLPDLLGLGSPALVAGVATEWGAGPALLADGVLLLALALLEATGRVREGGGGSNPCDRSEL